MRQARIYYGDQLAGILSETAGGEFSFAYDPAYVEAYPNDFVTFSMPVRLAPYRSSHLFPVFDGLIPEGWLLDIAKKTWKVSPNDRMGLLLACCGNCIGALSVAAMEGEDE